MSSREDILASIRQHTQTRYDKPDIADMKRLKFNFLNSILTQT